MKTHYDRVRRCFSLLCLFVALVMPAVTGNAAQSTQEALVLEVVYTVCHADCDHDTSRLYTSGRLISERVFQERAKSGRTRRVETKQERRLEPDEIKEIVGWAEQADFLNAQTEYVVTTVQDSPSYITITYFDKRHYKKVRVSNFAAGNETERAKVPLSIMKLARWAQPDAFPGG